MELCWHQVWLFPDLAYSGFHLWPSILHCDRKKFMDLLESVIEFGLNHSILSCLCCVGSGIVNSSISDLVVLFFDFAEEGFLD